MTSHVTLVISVCALLPLLPLGCIHGSGPGDGAEQAVVVQVAGDDSEAVASARITFTRDFRGSFTVDGFANDDESYLERNQGGFATTDTEGRASLVLPTYTLCTSTVFLVPGFGFRNCEDPLSDQVTGEAYLFRVETETGSEFFSVRMQAGASVSVGQLTLTVVSIGEATPRS